VRKVVDPIISIISTVAQEDNEWSASKLGRIASEANASGTRRIGGPLDITVTLIAINKCFWPGMIFITQNVYINSKYEINISRSKNKFVNEKIQEEVKL
jgi:hypothetical protein